MKTREQIATELYNDGRDSVMQGGDSLRMLAGHIPAMVYGVKDNDGALWQDRAFPDKTVHLDRFEDYLLKPARDGLGIPSLLWLSRVLDAHEEKGERERAIAALRQEIPDFDGRVEKERARASVKVEAAKDPHARPGNANAKKENNAVNNVNPESKRSKKAGNNAEYIIARLKRDAATNTHAAALLGSIEAPLRLLVPPGASWPGYPSLTPYSGQPGALRPIDGLESFSEKRLAWPQKKKAPISDDRGLCVFGAKDFAPFLCFRLATKNPIQCLRPLCRAICSHRFWFIITTVVSSPARLLTIQRQPNKGLSLRT